MAADSLQQVEGAGDVAADEFAGAGDRTVHMAFRRQMHHQVGIGLLNGSLHGLGILEVDP